MTFTTGLLPVSTQLKRTISKNDLTTSSSGKILTYTDNSKVSLLVGPSVVVANVPERVGGGGN